MTDAQAKNAGLHAALRMWSHDLRTQNPYVPSDDLIRGIEQILNETEAEHPGTIDRGPYVPVFTRPLRLMLLALFLAFLILAFLAYKK